MASEEEEAVKGAKGTDLADERPAFSCAGACFYSPGSGEIFTLLVYVLTMCVLQCATASHPVVT